MYSKRSLHKKSVVKNVLEESQQDLSKVNKYFFNLLQEWCLWNRGESMIGVNSIFEEIIKDNE